MCDGGRGMLCAQSLGSSWVLTVHTQLWPNRPNTKLIGPGPILEKAQVNFLASLHEILVKLQPQCISEPSVSDLDVIGSALPRPV